LEESGAKPFDERIIVMNPFTSKFLYGK